MMQHRFVQRHKHSHNHSFQEVEYKVLKYIDKNHKIAIQVKPNHGDLPEIGNIFLIRHDETTEKKIYEMEEILSYLKEMVSTKLYLEVEKFFMEREI